jgi:microcystin-dependent protein
MQSTTRYSFVNDNGAPLTQEQADIAEKIIADSADRIMQPVIGMIVASPFALDGFLVCDGSTYNTADYPLLGALYNSGATFTVPDLRSRFIYGASFSKPIGTSGGSESVTLDISQIPSHSHSESIALPFLGEVGAGVPITYATASSGFTGTSGGGGAHENMPPYVTMLWLISAG